MKQASVKSFFTHSNIFHSWFGCVIVILNQQINSKKISLRLTCFSGLRMLLLFGFIDIVSVPFDFWWFLAAAKFSISNLIKLSNWAIEFQSSMFGVLTASLSFRRLGLMSFTTGFGDSLLSTVSFTSIALSWFPFTWWSLSNTSEISFCVIEAAWKDRKKRRKISL